MTVLTDKEQALVRAIGITDMSTHRAGFARVVGIYFDRHRTVQEGFIGYHALQLSKRPFGVGSIGTPLFPGRFLATLAPGSFADVCQDLQTNQAVGVPGDDAR